MRFIGTFVVFSFVAVILAEDAMTAAPAAGDPAAAPLNVSGPAAAPPPPSPGPDGSIGATTPGSADAAVAAMVPDMSGAPADANGTAPITPNALDGNKVDQPAQGAAAEAPVTPEAVTAPFVQYKFDCGSEVDDSGPKCAQWAKGGFCEKHKATKFLFCRKTCLCTGA